jgi:hypothetical protein
MFRPSLPTGIVGVPGKAAGARDNWLLERCRFPDDHRADREVVTGLAKAIRPGYEEIEQEKREGEEAEDLDGRTAQGG